jgi:transposase-like protein
MDLFDLAAIIGDESASLAFLQQRGVLPTQKPCPSCNEDMELDAHLFRCRKRSCETKVSVRDGTVFQRTHLPFQKWVAVLHRWARGATPKELEDDCSISHPTACKLSKLFRQILYSNNERFGAKAPLGGPGRTVEIDESKLSRRKYNTGRSVEETWVFGAIERGSGRYKMEIVARRNEVTLLQKIALWIAPGSRIISDCFASYQNLIRHGYIHNTVNHKRYFVDPVDSEIHTNTIENRWKHTKHFLKYKGSNIKKHLAEYLVECLFRDANENAFDGILREIRVYQSAQ